jgi:hypothetical protein
MGGLIFPAIGLWAEGEYKKDALQKRLKDGYDRRGPLNILAVINGAKYGEHEIVCIKRIEPYAYKDENGTHFSLTAYGAQLDEQHRLNGFFKRQAEAAATQTDPSGLGAMLNKINHDEIKTATAEEATCRDQTVIHFAPITGLKAFAERAYKNRETDLDDRDWVKQVLDVPFQAMHTAMDCVVKIQKEWEKDGKTLRINLCEDNLPNFPLGAEKIKHDYRNKTGLFAENRETGTEPELDIS